jgi:hypothetical protein
MKLLKFLDWVDSFSIPEMILIFVFVLFIILPIQPTIAIAQFFNSALGMAILFFLTMAFFVVTHPVVGVVFLFVAYEVLRRSSLKSKHIPVIHAPTLAGSRPGTQSSNASLQDMRQPTHYANHVSTLKPHSPVDASITAPDLLKPHQKQVGNITHPPLVLSDKQSAPRINQGPLIKEGGVDLGTQSEKDRKMAELNPHPDKTLEEDIISKFGPLNGTSTMSLDMPTYKPVSAKLPAALFN